MVASAEERGGKKQFLQRHFPLPTTEHVAKTHDDEEHLCDATCLDRHDTSNAMSSPIWTHTAALAVHALPFVQYTASDRISLPADLGARQIAQPLPRVIASVAKQSPKALQDLGRLPRSLRSLAMTASLVQFVVHPFGTGTYTSNKG